MAVGYSANRTPLFARFQGGSLVVTDVNRVPQNVWFVGPAVISGANSTAQSANTTSYGRTPEAPFLTLAYALTQVSIDDTIFLMPGHTETVSGGDLDINTGAGSSTLAGLRIIGLGTPGVAGQGATISFGDATSALKISQTGVLIENVFFNAASFAAVAVALKVQASAATIRRCGFQTATAVNQATAGIVTNASASRMRIEGCDFFATTNAATTAVTIVGGDSIRILDSYFYGAYGLAVGGIRNTGTLSTNLVINNNSIVNATASSTKAITALAGTTGMVCNNCLSILSGTAPVTAAGMSWAGQNFFTNAAGTGAILL